MLCLNTVVVLFCFNVIIYYIYIFGMFRICSIFMFVILVATVCIRCFLKIHESHQRDTKQLQRTNKQLKESLKYLTEELKHIRAENDSQSPLSQMDLSTASQSKKWWKKDELVRRL